jgi:hypothetical protein
MAYVAKLSSAGGVKSLTRYVGVLAGNTVWNPYDASGYEPITAVIVPSGGLSSITISSIPQTYSHLQVRYLAKSGRVQNLAGQMVMRFNGSYGARGHNLYGDGSGTAANSYVPAIGEFALAATGSTAGNTFGVGIIDVLDYANTNKNKTIRSLTGADINGSGNIFFSSQLINSTTAISSISFESLDGGTNLQQYTSFALYGIKG